MIDHCDLKYSGVHAVHTMNATDILPLGSPGSHLGRVLLNAVVLLIKPGVGTKAFEVRLQAFVLLTCLACSFTCSQDSTAFGATYGLDKPARNLNKVHMHAVEARPRLLRTEG